MKFPVRPALLCLAAVFGLNGYHAQADPSPPQASALNHYQSGLAYERLGRLEEAYTDLQVACALDSENATMALALGIVATRMGRYEEGQRALDHSIVLDANSVASYYESALLYEKLHQTDRAVESWHRFLDLSQDQRLKLEAQKHIRYLETQHLQP